MRTTNQPRDDQLREIDKGLKGEVESKKSNSKYP